MTQKKSLWTNWKILLWTLFVVASLFLMVRIDTENGLGLSHNLKLGAEFSGGTLFQLQLAQPATTDQMQEIRLIVEKRLNPTGIKDVTVSNSGPSIVLAQVAETDPEAVEQLQSLLLKQGRFESFLNGDLIFDGSEIVQVIESAQQGYGAQPTGIGSEYQWTLPFLLSDAAAQKFAQAAFHQCTQTGFSNGNPQYDCALTYFFIDRPANSVVVYPQNIRSSDSGKLFTATQVQLSDKVTISSILNNANLNLIETDTNVSALDANQLAYLDTLPSTVRNAIVPAGTAAEVIAQLEGAGLEVNTVAIDAQNPWIVQVSGLRDAIALSPGITGQNPFIENIEDVKPQQFLVIQGVTPDAETAKQRLDDLRVILKSGALPIPIISINKQTVSPELGEQFLSNVWIMGILSLAIVALIVFIRYRTLNLVVPVLLVGLSEVIMILGFAAYVKWNLDLASMAGILAAVGTGVDSEVIMTDEILQGTKEEEENEKGWTDRAKRAFFIVAASASTSIATMLPLIILGSGIGKLSGFALTTIAGVLLGVLISRPAFNEIIKEILSPKKHEHHAHGEHHAEHHSN